MSISDGWTNVKGKPLIRVLVVSVSGAIFLSAYDYSDNFKTGINIAEPLLDIIEKTGPYRSSLIMLLTVRKQEQLLRINTPTYFGLGVWFTQ